MTWSTRCNSKAKPTIVGLRCSSESGEFNFSDVVTNVVTKLERRHPHVFADTKVEDQKQLDIDQQKPSERVKSLATSNTVPVTFYLKSKTDSLRTVRKVSTPKSSKPRTGGP